MHDRDDLQAEQVCTVEVLGFYCSFLTENFDKYKLYQQIMHVINEEKSLNNGQE